MTACDPPPPARRTAAPAPFNFYFASRLRLFAAGSPVLVYDSGVQQRTDSILVFPRFPAASPGSGQVAVVGLNYGPNNAGAVIWPNLLG